MSGPPRILFVSDLDGTLLGPGGSLGALSVRLLNEAIDAGLLFTYATARSFRSSRRATAELHLTLPVITYGGTVTAHPNTGEPFDVHFLAREIVELMISACTVRPLVEPMLFTFEDGSDWVRWRPEFETPGTASFVAARAGDRRLRPVTDADPVDLDTVFYVSLLAPREDLLALRDDLAPALKATAHFLSEDPSTPLLSWLEFHSPTGTKAEAIQRLMQDQGADKVIVFGDNHNDVPMFIVADAAYAVANAVPELLKIATGVIGTNDSEAVARWIATDGMEQLWK